MKIRSIEKIKISETARYELVVKDNNSRPILTEGSVMDCDDEARQSVRSLFEAPEYADLTDIGMIVIDSDDLFAKFLHTAQCNSELDELDNQTFQLILNEQAGQKGVRKELQKSFSEIIRTRLGIIVSSLNEDFEVIANRKEQLESMGYDCMACFLNFSLQEVIARRNGTNVVNDEQTSELWRGTQKNLARHSELFDGQIVVVNGADPEKFMQGILFAVEGFVLDPVQNTKGQNLTIRARSAHEFEGV